METKFADSTVHTSESGESDQRLNAIEADAQEQIPADVSGKALHEERPMLCPPVCLGYGAGAFVAGYAATTNVANSGKELHQTDQSALRELAEQEVTADASIDELLEARQ